MADTYEQNLGAKSSLTPSDYIRVVGSDNVSYKQGVPSVLAGMGLSLYYSDTNSTSDGSTDSDRYKMSFQRVLTTFSNSSPTVNRTYPIMIVTSGSSSGTFGGVVDVTATAMRFFVSYNNFNYTGQFARSSNTINAFERMPTRAEVDALKTVSSITPSEVASDITNNLFIRKQSGVVTINGYITRTNAFTSTQTQVMILPAGARPASQVRAACALSGAAYNPPAAMGYLLIDSTGYMGITAPASNTSKVAYFSVSYIAQA